MPSVVNNNPTLDGTLTPSSTLLAQFTDTTQSERHEPCSVETVGGCSLHICPVPEPPFYSPAPVSRTVGHVTIEGALQSPLVLTPQKDASGELLYYSVDPTLYIDDALLAGGEEITVTAPGEEVPAFSLTHRAPTFFPVKGLMPDHGTPLGGITLDSTTDLVLSFQGSADELFYLQLDVANDTTGAELRCLLPASSGTLTVPAIALTKLRSVALKGYFIALSETFGQTTVGGWDIDLYLFGPVRGEQGALLPTDASLTLE